jgi:pimeloyl-ACP methyl ester carboxylesterase
MKVARLESSDGTTIAYRHWGSGPGLVLVHGAMLSSRSFSRLAEALADSFHVYVPDRRGRGRSGPFGPAYGLDREVEDLESLLKETGATRVFGLSSGALIALEAARQGSRIERLAVYEPPFTVPGADPAAWVPRYTREVEQGRLASAMVTVLQGSGDRELLTYAPRLLLVPFMHWAMKLDARSGGPDHVSVRDLVPTVRYDAQLQREATSQLEKYAELRCATLIMCGSRSNRTLHASAAALGALLPRATRVQLAKTGHTAAENGGRPMDVAAALRRFFA